MAKAELLQQMHEARVAWDAVVARIPDEEMDKPGVEGPWSAKDVLTHVMGYERWTAAQIHASLRGSPPTAAERYDTDDIPAGIDESDQEEFNAAIERLYGEWPVTRVRDSAQRAFAGLVTAIESLKDADLADPNRFEWCEGMALSDVLPRQTWQHYTLHLPALRTLTEDQGG